MIIVGEKINTSRLGIVEAVRRGDAVFITNGPRAKPKQGSLQLFKVNCRIAPTAGSQYLKGSPCSFKSFLASA